MTHRNRTEIRANWGDCDAAGIIFYPVYFRWFDECTQALLSKPDRLAHEPATALIESWLRYRVMETSVQLVQQALASALRWRISYWDAAIIEAARSGSCSELLSEDLQAGMNFAGVTVVDPFAAGGSG